jgi:predicted transcriptional regulator
VTAPPADGDDIDRLAFAIDELRTDVEDAVKALVNVGLAERDGQRVRATAAALLFDALWPVRS